MLFALLTFFTATAPVTRADAQLLSALVAASASKDARLDVLSAADVRSAVDVEAQRALMGCDQSSCLLEVANALDARLVIHGNVGLLGDTVVLTLNAFDTAAASALGRVVVQEASVQAAGRALPAAVQELLARVPPLAAGAPRLRALALDLTVSEGAASAAVSPPAAPAESFLLPGLGIGAFSVGALGLGLGIGMDAWAADAAAEIHDDTPQIAAQAVQQQREQIQMPTAIAGYAIAAAGAAAGIVLFAVHLGGE